MEINDCYRLKFNGFTILLGVSPTEHPVFRPEKGSELEEAFDLCLEMMKDCEFILLRLSRFSFPQAYSYSPPRWEDAFDNVFKELRNSGKYPHFKEEYIVPKGQEYIGEQETSSEVVY